MRKTKEKEKTPKFQKKKEKEVEPPREKRILTKKEFLLSSPTKP